MEKPSNRLLILWHASNVVLFLLYWGFFGAVTNWWVGFIAATVVFLFQRFVKRTLDKVELKNE